MGEDGFFMTTLRKLETFTVYEFRVTAVNSHGPSPTSEDSHVYTTKKARPPVASRTASSAPSLRGRIASMA